MDILLANLFLISFVLFILNIAFDYSKKIFNNIDSSDIFSKGTQVKSQEDILSQRRKPVHSKISHTKSHMTKRDRYEGRYADYKEYKKYKKI